MRTWETTLQDTNVGHLRPKASNQLAQKRLTLKMSSVIAEAANVERISFTDVKS